MQTASPHQFEPVLTPQTFVGDVTETSPVLPAASSSEIEVSLLAFVAVLFVRVLDGAVGVVHLLDVEVEDGEGLEAELGVGVGMAHVDDGEESAVCGPTQQSVLHVPLMVLFEPRHQHRMLQIRPILLQKVTLDHWKIPIASANHVVL